MRSLIILFFFISSYTSAQSINSAVYSALSDSSDAKILQQIELLVQDSSSSQSKAYLGTLYMKQAAYLKTVNKKVNSFKEGKFLLENELSKYPDNIEYHFLRLIIQENAPSILKYNKDLEADLDLIYKQYSSLDADLKKVILNYSKSSLLIDTKRLDS